MDHKEDRAFIRQFSGVVAAFIVLTIVLIFVARGMQPETEGVNANKAVLVEQRIAPVGAVRSGEAGAAALAEAQAAAAEIPSAEDAVVDGAAVYGSLCMACHETGVSDAPIRGSELMAAREAERGLEGLVSNAINGLNVMPPRGGNPALTDEQVRAAVEHMLQ